MLWEILLDRFFESPPGVRVMGVGLVLLLMVAPHNYPYPSMIFNPHLTEEDLGKVS
jgi:hypothetical protein